MMLSGDALDRAGPSQRYLRSLGPIKTHMSHRLHVVLRGRWCMRGPEFRGVPSRGTGLGKAELPVAPENMVPGRGAGARAH